MVLVGVERVDGIAPSIIKTLDVLIVVLLTHSNDEVLVLDDASIAESDLICAGIDLFDTHVIGLGNVLADDLASRGTVVKLGDAGCGNEYLPCS